MAPLKNPPLDGVLTQLVFGSPLRVSAPSVSSTLEQTLQDAGGYEFQSTQLVAPFATVGETPPEQPLLAQVFKTPDDLWQLSISDRSLSIEISPGLTYPDFETFQAQFSAGLQALTAAGAPPKIERFGVRYINTLKEPDIIDSPGDFIAEKYLAVIKSGPEKSALKGSYSETQWGLDMESLTIRSGFLPPEFRPKSFLLDFDCYIEQPVDFSVSALEKHFASCHEIIENEFVASLNPKYLERLATGENDELAN